MSHPAFREVAHRPWPLPRDPWIGSQTWHDLAFLHWRIEPSRIAHLVPRALTVEQFDGSAWIAVTPFWMSGVTLRGVPPLPGLSTFPELNVRTYVRHGAKAGIWFFSLDAANRLAVWAARLVYRLNYVHAEMHVKQTASRIDYSSRRDSGHEFLASYGPTGAVAHPAPGTLEHFLTERYCLYAQLGSDKLHSAEIHHVRWPLQPAEVELRRNDMTTVNGIVIDGPPLAHFAKRLDVAIWPLRVVR